MAVPARPEAPRYGAACVALLCAGFVAAVLLVDRSLVLIHGDEFFYMDAARGMLATGDFLTPYYQDGQPRFLKPAMSYWPIVASLRLFGVHLFAAHLPSMTAAVLTLWVTWRLTRLLFGNREAAALAVALLVSNNPFLEAAARARPDMLLGLFLTLGFYGFARLIFSEEGRPRHAYLAYASVGLATATKGLLALAAIPFALLIASFRRTPGGRRRPLAPPGAVLVCALLGSFWFVAMYAIHGRPALTHFFDDQVGEKVAGSVFAVLERTATYARAPLHHFLPWTALLAWLAVVEWSALWRFVREHRAACLYAGGWFAVVVVIFGFGSTTRYRYLVPAYPLLASLGAALIVAGLDAPVRARAAARWIHGTLLVLGLGLGAGLLAVGSRGYSRLAAGGVFFLVLTGLAWAALRRGDRRRPNWAATALWVAGAIAGQTYFVESFFDPSPVRRMVRSLESLRHVPTRVAYAGGRSEHARAVEWLSGERFKTSFHPVSSDLRPLSREPVVIASERALEQLDVTGREIRPIAFELDDWSGGDLWSLVRDGPPALERRKLRYYLAVRPHGE